MTKSIGSNSSLHGGDFEVVKVFPFNGKDIVIGEQILDGKFVVLENYTDLVFESYEYSNCRRYVEMEYRKNVG
jgi:hypothetical protein